MVRVRRIEHHDGSRRVDFFDRGDGLFSYESECEAFDDVPGLGPLIYWKCEYQSGLYGTLEDAERDAFATIGWLHETPE